MTEKIVTYKGFRYRLLNDTEAELIDASVATGHVVIPETIVADSKTYTVTSISSYKVSHMERVRINDKRCSLGYKIEERGIKEYTLSPFRKWRTTSGYPNSIDLVERKEEEAITEITLPKTLKHVKRWSFSGLRPSKPDPYNYGGWPYINGGSPISIILPEGVEDVETYACSWYDVIELHIPSSVKKVPEEVMFVMETKDIRDRIREMAKAGAVHPSIIRDSRQIIIHNDEGYVDVSLFNYRINYVGKPKGKQEKVNKQEVRKSESESVSGATIDLEKLIQAALVDGVVTDKERAVLVKKVKEAGGDVDEFEMLLDARIYEAQQKNGKAKSEPKPAPKPEPKPAKPAIEPKEEPKPAVKPVSTNGNLTVGSVVEAFKKQFGAVLRIYNGRSKADGGISLQDVGLKQEISTTFDGKQKVGDFIAQMAKVGLTVKVYTCDDWVAVLDGLTLEQAGKVKKSATKADMEKML